MENYKLSKRRWKGHYETTDKFICKRKNNKKRH